VSSRSLPRPERQGCGEEGPCISERGSCHPEGCSGYDRVHGGDTPAPPPVAARSLPDCPRAHLEEKPPCLVLHMEMSMCREVLHKECCASCRTDTGPRKVIALQMVISAFCTAGPYGGGRCRRRHFVGSRTNALSHEVPLSCLAQDTGCMSPGIPNRFTEIVQHCRLFALPCFSTCLCLDHRELHSRCSLLIPRSSTLLSSFTYISYDGGVLFQVVWVRGMGRSYLN